MYKIYIICLLIFIMFIYCYHDCWCYTNACCNVIINALNRNTLNQCIKFTYSIVLKYIILEYIYYLAKNVCLEHIIMNLYIHITKKI